MPATDHQGSFLYRISIRRNQVVSMGENSSDHELSDLELFQKNVTDNLAGIVSGNTPSDAVLSVAWFRKLLDTFLCCEAEFKVVLLMGRDPTQLNKPPMDRLIQEYMDRVVKALDICNAVTHAVDLVRQWQKLAEIAVAALEQRPIGEGQVRRAKKALNTLLTCINNDQNRDIHTAKSAYRTWSFNRRGTAAAVAAPPLHRSSSRSLSFPNSWSSAKEIQSMSTNLVAPRGVEAAGLALPVYIMSTILVFTMWALVAAFPCQDRNGLPAQFVMGKQLGWAQPIIMMQEKIGEEWKKKDKKMMSSGLLEETQRMEKVAVALVEFAEAEKADEMAAQVAELGEICRKMEQGLGALQQQIREVFHRIVRSRAEVLDVVDQIGKI